MSQLNQMHKGWKLMGGGSSDFAWGSRLSRKTARGFPILTFIAFLLASFFVCIYELNLHFYIFVTPEAVPERITGFLRFIFVPVFYLTMFI